MLLYFNTHLLLAQTEIYSGKQGLSQNSVYSIIQDKSGRIWANTGDGLNVFDGKKFVVHSDPNDSFHRSAYPGNFVQDANGDIWIGGLPGLYQISADGNSVRNICTQLGLNKKSITMVFGPFGDEICIQEQGAWLVFYNVKTKTIKRFDFRHRFPLAEQIQFVLGLNGYYLLLTNNGLYKFVEHKNQLDLIYNCNNAKAVLLSDSQMLLYDSQLRLFSLRGNSWQQSKLNAIPYRMVVKNFYLIKGEIYLGTQNLGLFILDPKSLVVKQHYFNDFKQGENQISIVTAVYLDHDNQLWVGTDGQGLVRYNLNAKYFGIENHFANPKKLSGNDHFVKCFLELNSREIWIGTYNGLYSKNRVTQKIVPLNLPGVEGKIISILFKDGSNGIWVGTEMGIYYRVNGASEFVSVAFQTFNTGEVWDQFFNAVAEKNGDVYFATRQGVGVYDKNTKQIKIIAFHKAWIMYVSFDLKGNLWVSSYQGKTFILDLNKPSEMIAEMFPRLNLRYLLPIKGGKNYLAATENGVFVISENYKIIQNYNTKNLLFSDLIYGIIEEKQGVYWLSSNSGLMRLNTEENKCRRFIMADGLQSNEFNTGAFLKLHNGEFLFGGIKGYNQFSPQKIAQLHTNGTIALTSFLTRTDEGRWINHTGNQEIKIAYNQNSAEISFLYADYAATDDVVYFYKLNKNSSWISIKGDPHLYLSNLEMGKYEVWVKVRDHFGIESAPKLLARFAVVPPFYRTGWFIALALMLAGFCIYLFTRYLYKQKLVVAEEKAKRQEEIHSLRLNISRELHDNLGASLSRVALLSHKMRAIPDSDNHQKTASSISKLTSEINNQVRNIVWSLDHAYDNVEGLGTYLRHYALNFLEENSKEVDLDIPLEMPAIAVGPDVRQVLFSVTKEALNNAVKYSESPKISLSFHCDESGQFEICIQDFGIGFDPSKERKFSHGLKNMVQRTAELGFVCLIKSSIGEGTIIRISGYFQLLH